MKILIVPNLSNDKAIKVCSDVIDKLNKLKVDVILEQEINSKKKYEIMSTKSAYKICDYVISIGGDGSIIHTAKRAAVYNKAVLGINCGRLGYLSGLEADEIEKIEMLVNGDFVTESRSMLKAEFCNGNKQVSKDFLNDAVIAKGAISRMVDIKVGFGGNDVQYHADGVIVSTSTGATAYSMSAGGPIVSPELDLMLVTPISAHSFHNRSIALGIDNTITLTNMTERHSDVYLSIDGEQAFMLKNGAEVVISKSDYVAKIIKIDNVSFFETLSRKIQ